MINYKKNGFAITALLYGLSIMALMVVALMMSVMQNSRKNSSTLVRSIEEELNAYGETTQEYTSGSPTYYVPEGQTGFFKIELRKNNTMVTGTIYLQEGITLNLSLDGSKATVSTNVSGINHIIMSAGNADSDIFVAGMAKYSSSTVPKQFQFINGQIIKNTSSLTSFKATKVAEVSPVSNNIFDNVTKIEATGANSIKAVTYNSSAPGTGYDIKTGTNTVNIGGNGISISEIYINYNSNVSNPTIKLTRVVNGVTSTPIISEGSLPSGYNFKSGGYTLSRFGPTNTGNKNEPKNGNYYMSLVSKNTSSKVFTFDQQNTLSTTFYTPANVAAANTAVGETNSTKLVKYGTESYGRPVANTQYTGLNSQKWRLEAIGSGFYKITEIEEYKPFEVHKQDATFDSAEPNGPGPILICGAYAFLPTWTSTDTFTGNINQRWTLVAAGLGSYYLKTNHSHGDRFLYYDGSKKKYYVTNTKDKASLFQLTNADL